MIREEIRKQGKKEVTVYLVDYIGYDSGERVLLLALMLTSRLDRKVEIDCDNKIVECMSIADAEKVEECLNA